MVYLIVLTYVLVVLTVTSVIANTETPSKALGYTLLIVVFPILGILIYLILGTNHRKNKIYKKKLIAGQLKFKTLEQKRNHFFEQTLSAFETSLAHFYPLASSRGIEQFLTSGNSAKLLINGEQKFQELLHDLSQARHHIHIEYYIYEADEIGHKIANILCERAKQGVEVRFVYDAYGSRSLSSKLINQMKQAGVQVFPFYKTHGLFFANRINYRNHRKVVIIDGKVGYVGGINVSDKYINNGKQNLFWRDTHLKLTGYAALSLQYVFLTDWNFCADDAIQITEDYFPFIEEIQFDAGQLVEVVSSGPDSDSPNILYSMIQAIVLAKEEVLITTPYFIPNASFLDALKIAKKSGVRVTILVPGVSDSFFVDGVSNTYYENLLEAGIEIYKYSKGFVHAKTMVCDQRVAFVGTTNLDHRSFDLNFEINAIVYDTTVAAELAAAFHADLTESTRLELEEWKERPFYRVLLERFFRMFSPLM